MVGITRRKVIIVTTNSRKEKIPEPTVPQGTADFFFWRAKCQEFNQISWCAQNAHLSREKHSERVLRPSCNKGCQLVHESLGEKREARGLPLYSKHKNWEPMVYSKSLNHPAGTRVHQGTPQNTPSLAPARQIPI